MTILDAVLLGLLQALGEFLPISSSAHLVLLPFFRGHEYQGLAFDVMLHAATLLAVLLYFVVAVGVCLLFWAVFTIFTHFGLLHTMFFTDKATLAGGFFEVCQAYVEPMIANVEATLGAFFAKLGA